jgi:hypothetical protein
MFRVRPAPFSKKKPRKGGVKGRFGIFAQLREEHFSYFCAAIPNDGDAPEE